MNLKLVKDLPPEISSWTGTVRLSCRNLLNEMLPSKFLAGPSCILKGGGREICKKSWTKYLFLKLVQNLPQIPMSRLKTFFQPGDAPNVLEVVVHLEGRLYLVPIQSYPVALLFPISAPNLAKSRENVIIVILTDMGGKLFAGLPSRAELVASMISPSWYIFSIILVPSRLSIMWMGRYRSDSLQTAAKSLKADI